MKNCNLCGADLSPIHALRKINLWEELVNILENNFPKLNYEDVSKPSSNNRAQALVMLSDIARLLKVER